MGDIGPVWQSHLVKKGAMDVLYGSPSAAPPTHRFRLLPSSSSHAVSRHGGQHFRLGVICSWEVFAVGVGCDNNKLHLFILNSLSFINVTRHFKFLPGCLIGQCSNSTTLTQPARDNINTLFDNLSILPNIP